MKVLYTPNLLQRNTYETEIVLCLSSHRQENFERPLLTTLSTIGQKVRNVFPAGEKSEQES